MVKIGVQLANVFLMVVYSLETNCVGECWLFGKYGDTYFCLWQTELGRNRHYNMTTPTAIIFLFMTDRAGKKQTLQYGNANCNHISVYDRQSWEETDTTIWQRQLQSYFCLWQTELGRNRHYNMAMPTAIIFLFITDRAGKKQTLQYGNANCNHISVYDRQSWEETDTTIWQRQLQSYFCLWQTELGRNRHYNMATPTAIIFLFMTDRAGKKQTLQYGNANCNHISVYDRQSWEETDTTIWQRQLQSYFCLWQTELGRNRHYNMATPTAIIFLFMTDRAGKKQTLQYGNANCNHISVYDRQSWEETDTTIWQRQLQSYFCLWQTELGRNRHYNMTTPTAIIFLFMTDRAGKKQTLQYDNANCNHISVYDRQSWEETDTTIWQRQLQSYFCLWQTELGRNRHYNMATPTAIIFLFMTDRAGKKQTLQYGNANCNHISVYDRQSWEETDTTIWQRQLQSYFCLWQTELGRNRHYNMTTPTAIIFLFMTDRAGKKQTLQYGNANCNHISVYDRQSWEETDTTIWQRQLQSYFCL